MEKPATRGIEATAQAANKASRIAEGIDASVGRMLKSLSSVQALAIDADRLVTSGISPKILAGLTPDLKIQFASTGALDRLIGGVGANSWRNQLAGAGTAFSAAKLVTEPMASTIALRHTWASSDALAGLQLAGIDTSVRLPML